MGLADTHRYDRLDALRGAAVVWMTVFHFCFDLNHFGWLKENFYRDPFWTGQRTAIVSLFLFCAGAGQAIALAQGQGWPRFWKRWAQVAGCAVLVTAGSWFMFPRSYIFFGVLHGIAVMLILVRLTAGWRRWLWVAGALAILAPVVARAAHAAWPTELDFLNQAGWNVLGLVSRKPVTEDYVPLFPWLGVVWWGVAAMQEVLRAPGQWVSGPVPSVAGPLAWLGRWSLSWYMLHQPVLIGLLAAFTALAR
jgi:uncharacterized membrane protein